jgi:2-polyprenyl-3-methyl-5-hydroxy-6-metoxy-1,4-benzoquinol methylase
MSAPSAQPSPEVIFNAMNAYQRSMTLKGAIDLELFTHIADGATTAAELAKRSSASERGIWILCDYLTIQGFLTKSGQNYGLSPDAAVFLNKKSPAYMGSMAGFLVHEVNLAKYRDIAAVVRHGGSLPSPEGHMDPDNPIWVEFARSMAPMAAMGGRNLAPLVTKPGTPVKVLDIAAGHGLYGISVALFNPAAQIVGVDWKNVLAVALENAAKAGVSDRYQTIPGSAFDVDLGSGYDLVLLPNFLHHFSAATNTALLKKIRAALKPGGQVATLEFVPNDDRITPPMPAAFSMIMLATTDHGDAFTFRELDQMFRDAGFSESTLQDMPQSPQRLILSKV